MTLLEVVVSFVLLAVVGVACLELANSATGLERRSVEWAQAVAEGEAALASAVADGGSSMMVDPSGRTAFPGSRSTTPVVVTREPWSFEADIDVYNRRGERKRRKDLSNVKAGAHRARSSQRRVRTLMYPQLNSCYARRRGFTLIELITAITLSAIVLAIAGSALTTATRAQTIIVRNQHTIDAESRWRTTSIRYAATWPPPGCSK